MLNHYLKIIWRSFIKHGSYNLINIIGITTGMVVFILIMLYVRFELSVDQYHENKDRIYRVARQDKGNIYEGDDRYAVTMAPLGPILMDEFPEVQSVARISFMRNAIIMAGQEKYREPLIYGVDKEVFDIFSFEYSHRITEHLSTEKSSVVISDTYAKKYFKQEDPVGQIITIKSEYGEFSFAIKGVIQDMPDNSHFRMDIMIPFETFLGITGQQGDLQNWSNNNYYTYLLLKKGHNKDILEEKMQALLETHLPFYDKNGKHITSLFLQEFSKIHLYSNIKLDIGSKGDPIKLFLLSTLATIVLLLACINYINLNTARAITRAKEVGIRKINGADQKNLVFQFLGESMFLILLSFAVSLFVIFALLPYYNQFLEIRLSVNFVENPDLLLLLVALCPVIAILSGFYPAFVLSKFQPVRVLKGKLSSSHAGVRLRNSLVVFQFIISGVLIICSLTISRQMAFIQNKDLGYNRDQVIIVNLQDEELINKVSIFKNELLSIQGVMNVSSSSILPNGNLGSNKVRWPGKNENIDWQICTGRVDEHFIDLYEIEIIKGRNFSLVKGDENGAILINESAAKLLEWDDPIGRELSDWRDTCQIVGIVKDFHLHKLNKEIMPLQMYYHPSNKRISIKISGFDLEKTIAGIKNVKEKFSEQYPLDYYFFDQQFNETYKFDMKTGRLISWFTIATIILAFLGLFGLASFTLQLRAKEVSIRKVLGANTSELLNMLSRNYLYSVFISFIIAVPIAYNLMQNWLSTFAYHIELGFVILVITFLMMILLAILSIGYKTMKIACGNPVEILRSE